MSPEKSMDMRGFSYVKREKEREREGKKKSHIPEGKGIFSLFSIFNSSSLKRLSDSHVKETKKKKKERFKNCFLI